ncbi:DUF5106 domain-containing protein [Sphingobacterium kitahiroshimense]|uniref:DUF5106 domain-containing protein n=1 Tax=Sphingobacterium kitahiroshimense TaxID=470446 RepID=A0ABV0BW51_9SPHI
MKNSRHNFFLYLGLASLFLYSCNETNKAQKAPHNTGLETQTAKNPADSALVHFWDTTQLQHTVQIQNNEAAENQLAQFIGLLSQTPDSALRDIAVAKMLDKTKSNRANFDYYIKLYENYLYDGNSPLRNDILYEAVLRYLIKTDVLTDLEKEAYRPVYKLILRNKIGKPAEDFSYVLGNGTKQKLSEVKAKYTFLLFYDPDCPHCKEAIFQLRETPELVQLFSQLQVQIVTVDPSGDPKRWKAHLPELSDSWINGLDVQRTIMSSNLYDLKATPTMYLLNEDKKVLLKDSYLDQIIQYLVNSKAR